MARLRSILQFLRRCLFDKIDTWRYRRVTKTETPILPRLEESIKLPDPDDSVLVDGPAPGPTIIVADRKCTWNFSEGIAYHTQRNNVRIPFRACNTTAKIMGLKQAGHELPASDGQPEDELTRIATSDQAKAAAASLTPWFIDSATGEPIVPTNQIHAVLSWATNLYMGKTVSTFSTERTVQEILVQLFSGGGVVLSGRFPISQDEHIGHVVSLAGVIFERPVMRMEVLNPALVHQLPDVTHWIIDDPYGDYRVWYTNHNGNDVKMTASSFDSIIRDSHRALKWAHFIEPAGGQR